MPKEDYDGFYFLPGENSEELNLAYFKFKEENFVGEPIESTSVGDKYHIAFFRKDINGHPIFDDSFEAIFADPSVYIKGLVGAEVYGCVLRKTEKSENWWKEYLERAKKACLINKMIDVAKNIAESRL